MAESATETLLSLPPQHPWLEAGSHAGPGSSLYFDAQGAPSAPSAARFVVTWRVSANRTGGANLQGLRRIDVDVAWQHDGETRHTEWRLHRR